MGVELHVRYRAGREGVLLTFPDGSVMRLAPFAIIRLESVPTKIEGQLTRIRRARRRLEVKA